MGFSSKAISLLFLLLAQAVLQSQAGHIFDITKYGAKADGKSDISQALLRTWKEACAATKASTVLIPKGRFFLTEVIIAGPCKAPIELHVQGTLKAPSDIAQVKGDGWLTLNYIDHLTISGTGTFDGQGTAAWAQNDCDKNSTCKQFPVNLRLNFITNSVVRDVTSLDSKNFHVNVLGCNNLSFHHFTISAPETSINTDGIHIGRSTGINITDTSIKTGDDCVSMGDGSQQVHIERVTCGPGHGFSVGSLGRSANEEPVVGITVKNCTLTKAMNGVRVKTWPSSPSAGTASEMHFQDIIMNNVGTPITIDQEYCPYNQCKQKAPSLVKISNVIFKNIQGTSSSQLAVKLVCSKSVPCQNVEVADIDLTYAGVGGRATSQCANIHPKLRGKQNPATCVNSFQSSDHGLSHIEYL